MYAQKYIFQKKLRKDAKMISYKKMSSFKKVFKKYIYLSKLNYLVLIFKYTFYLKK